MMRSLWNVQHYNKDLDVFYGSL